MRDLGATSDRNCPPEGRKTGHHNHWGYARRHLAAARARWEAASTVSATSEHSRGNEHGGARADGEGRGKVPGARARASRAARPLRRRRRLGAPRLGLDLELRASRLAEGVVGHGAPSGRPSPRGRARRARAARKLLRRPCTFAGDHGQARTRARKQNVAQHDARARRRVARWKRASRLVCIAWPSPSACRRSTRPPACAGIHLGSPRARTPPIGPATLHVDTSRWILANTR